MPESYQNRNFMVYVTVDGVMKKAREYCNTYGYSLSKLGLIALIEKFEREGKLNDDTLLWNSASNIEAEWKSHFVTH